MENHHAINGKIHYKWPFSIAIHPKAASRCAAFSRAAAALCRARLGRREPRAAREALQTAMEAMAATAEGRCHGPWGCHGGAEGIDFM